MIENNANVNTAIEAYRSRLTRTQTRIQLMKLFDEDARIIHDYAWLEGNLGNLVPMEVVVRVEPSHSRQGGTDAEADGQSYRLNMFEQMVLIGAFPFWSLVTIIVSSFILYALIVPEYEYS